ncbi:MAG TPA: outer membrane beta-barrel protein [Terracidiphilus sp.]|jgi:opacity protein-like surface antigen|nr:outer membrane beta-barrel protein [Terracidiphilus sp.]
MRLTSVVQLLKRSSVVWLLLLAAGLAAHCPAQVEQSATKGGLGIHAGGEFSIFQPDYAGEGVAQTSPQRLYGLGAFIDADFSRWIQIEAQGRWLHWNQYAGIYQNTYGIGPRVPIHEFRRFTPYGKFLIGWGSMSDLNGKATALTYGGGVDYRLSPRLAARGDFEYQDWRVADPNLHPYGVSIGLSYRIF